jgi:hypothetical protein
MKMFLTIAAILAWAFGAMLLLVPARFYAPASITITPLLALLAQAHGAMLLGLGLINWRARHAEKPALIAVLTGNLLVQILSLLVVLRLMQLGAGPLVAPGIVIHIALGILFAFFLIKTTTSEIENPA